MFNVKDDNSSNEKLVSLDSIISYQKEEILKSELSISQFQKCLNKQNEVLNIFIAEKEKLEALRSKRSKLTNIDDKNCKEIYESVMKMGAQSSNRRKINRNSFKTIEIDTKETNAAGVKTEISVENTDKNNVDIMPEMNGEPSTKMECSTEMSINSKIQSLLKRIPITQIGDRTISSIVVFGKDICIGGYKGLLLKYASNKTYIYNTGTEEDIVQIEIIKRGELLSLFAFTSQRSLVFDTLGIIQRDIPLPGIGNVFNDTSLLYVPLNNGTIMKLYVDDYRVTTHCAHNHGNVHCFVPGTGKNQLALVSLQDSVLYKTDKKELITLEVVEGIRNVRKIIRVRYCNFLCYSNDRIWFFNSGFDLVNSVVFENGIKFVDVTYTTGAVVDGNNGVHIYNVLDSGCFGTKVCHRSVAGDVTAMAIVKRSVLIAVHCDIFTFENIF